MYVKRRGQRKALRRRPAFRFYVLLALAAACSFALAWAAPCALAAEYSFEVPDEVVRVRVNQDSSIDIWYRIDFRNDEGAAPVDIVDIGLPTTDFNPAECEASINGRSLVPGVDIVGSEVLKDRSTGAYLGVEIHLGSDAIQPGRTGTLDFHGKTPRMVFQDTARQGYASMEFKNTWWDPAYAHGTTSLTYRVQFPPGVQQNETVYHGLREPSRSEAEGCIVFTWVNVDAKPSEGYLFGVSFPAVYVSGVYPKQPSPDYAPVAPVSGSSTSSIYNMFGHFLYVIPGLILVVLRFIASFIRVRDKGVKVKYLAPSVGIEGVGPMTGLFPAEAAALASDEMDRVAAIVYFEMLEKGLVSLAGVKPLRFERLRAPAAGAPGYHALFLAAISPEGTIDRSAFKTALITLISGIDNKAKGFSHADTVDHYRAAAEAAWLDVRTTSDRRERMDKYSRGLPVLMLDPGFAEKTREAFGPGEFPAPAWIDDLRVLAEAPGARGPAGAEVSAAAGAGLISGPLFAEAVTRGFRAIQDSAFVHVSELEREILEQVNPEEYKRVYRPVWGVRRTYGGGGGGGCACACACAGCACACAGGGR